MDLKDMTDEELCGRLESLARTERRVTAEVLRHLAEYKTRKIGSLWRYCRHTLKYSEAEAALRVRAVSAIERDRRLLDLLEAGETTVSALAAMAPHLTADRKDALVEEVRGKSLDEVKWIAAREKAARLEAIVGRDFVKALERAILLLARRHPKGRYEEVLGDALELLLDREDPLRRDARRAERGSMRALRDAVFARDGGRCTARLPRQVFGRAQIADAIARRRRPKRRLSA